MCTLGTVQWGSVLWGIWLFQELGWRGECGVAHGVGNGGGNCERCVGWGKISWVQQCSMHCQQWTGSFDGG